MKHVAALRYVFHVRIVVGAIPGGGVLWEFLGGNVPLGPWNP